jgi:hypothetical protein
VGRVWGRIDAHRQQDDGRVRGGRRFGVKAKTAPGFRPSRARPTRFSFPSAVDARASSRANSAPLNKSLPSWPLKCAPSVLFQSLKCIGFIALCVTCNPSRLSTRTETRPQALALPVTDDGKKAWQSVRTRKARYAVWEIKDGAIHLYVHWPCQESYTWICCRSVARSLFHFVSSDPTRAHSLRAAVKRRANPAKRRPDSWPRWPTPSAGIPCMTTSTRPRMDARPARFSLSRGMAHTACDFGSFHRHITLEKYRVMVSQNYRTMSAPSNLAASQDSAQLESKRQDSVFAAAPLVQGVAARHRAPQCLDQKGD